MTVGMGVWAWRAWCLLRVGHRNHRIEPDSSHLFTASAAQLAMLVLTRTSRLNVPPGVRPVRTRENGDTLWRRLGTRGHPRVTIHSAATATPATCATINVGQIVLTRVASNWHVPNGQSCCGHLAGPSAKPPKARSSESRCFRVLSRLAPVRTALRRHRVSFVRVESNVDSAALRDARRRMGLTQHELARIIDVAGGERISRWELGSSAPRPEILRRLALALNIGVADLLEAGSPADLRRLRTAAGLSARTLAARTHISVPTYVRWESGRTKRLPARQALKPLAKVLNVTVEDVESAIVTARANAVQAD